MAQTMPQVVLQVEFKCPFTMSRCGASAHWTFAFPLKQNPRSYVKSEQRLTRTKRREDKIATV